MKNRYFKSLMIEPTNICNLQCPVCPTGNGYYDDKPKGSMSFPKFKKIIEPVKDFLRMVRLWGFGEPFLAPDILKMVDYLGENNIAAFIHTNGNVLNKGIIDNFKKNYKLEISFSIDGVTQKTYNYYRKGGSLKKALDNLSSLVDLKKKNNLNNLEIIWQFLVMKTNEHEVKEVKQMAKKIGVDKLRIKTINIGEDDSRYDDFVSKNKKYRRMKIINRKSQGCSFIDPGTPVVYWNGDVAPCCSYHFMNYYMGNAYKKDILNIWDNQKYRRFRERYLKGQNKVCNDRCKINKGSKLYFQEINFKNNQ